MDPLISPTCRFCLDGREEFSHLAHDCPALWWERLTVSSQDPEHSLSSKWTPTQILDFTFFSRINDAFAKPLYQIASPSTSDQHETLDVDNPTPSSMDIPSDTDTGISVMEVSSDTDSSSDSNIDPDSDITIDSDFSS